MKDLKDKPLTKADMIRILDREYGIRKSYYHPEIYIKRPNRLVSVKHS